MEYIIPLLIGITGKIIDEINDNKINIKSIYIESLKSLNVCLFTLAAQNDFLFSFSTLILSSFGAGIDTDYWKSFIIISLFLSIFNYSPIDNVPLFILILTIIIISTQFEENKFPEEYSIKKLYSRITGLIIFSFILVIPMLIKKYDIICITPNIKYIYKLLLIAVGGLIISIISQTYFLFFK
jgi:hypothetical protein